MRIFDTGVRFPDVDSSCGLEPSLREILVYYYRQAFAADEAAALANKYIAIVGVEAEIARLRAEADALRVEVEKYQKAVRKVRARADSEGTAKQHGMQYVAGLRNAANMIDAAMGEGK